MASRIECGERIAAGRGRYLLFSARHIALQIALVGFHIVALWAPPVTAGPKMEPGTVANAALALAIKDIAHPLSGAITDYDHLLRKIGNARIVLLGEDTHGTHEFYVERARITQRLIAEQGFAGVFIEGDWSEAAGVDPFLIGPDHDGDANQILRTFDRFPRWMWRNTAFRDFLVWLRRFNLERDAGTHPVTIRGLDLYEILPSVNAVIGYLARANPDAAARARERYSCLDPAAASRPEGRAAEAKWSGVGCGQRAQDQLTELASGTFLNSPAVVDMADGGYLHALQSARVVRNAEEYFRLAEVNPEAAWNLRDNHMASSVDLLLTHLDAATGARSRLVIWAHNAHVGDARATARGDAGGLTLGQVLRERYPDNATIVGFTTATGTVRAATDWGGPDRRKRLRPPVIGSHAALFNATGLPRFYLILDESPSVHAALADSRPQRGVGVRYLPTLEIAGHYYRARLSAQFDAVVHIDRTTALLPLRKKPPGRGKPP